MIVIKFFAGFKKTVSCLLAACLGLSAFSSLGVVLAADGTEQEADYISRVVNGENGAYIEYLGKPYLMYGMQMRLDWAYEDKSGDEEFIAENFKRVAEDGFTSVAIPIYWCTVEPTKDNYTFSRLELYYKYINQYDLTVQWLWFGANVCGGAGLVPSYIKNDTETYRFVKPNLGNGYYIDYSCEATLEREKLALGKMMEWLAENDTEKHCVMIQVNNEVDQGANYFDPGYYYDENGELKGNSTVGYWYNVPELHDAYCWAGGQREECFAYLSALGDVIHESDYNVVTRVNVSGAGRSMPEIADDLTDIIATSGIDIVGEDVYYKTWEDVQKYYNIIEGNVNHLAENGGNYDSSYNIAKTFELGGGVIIYCHREDREANGGSGIYINSQGDPAENANRKYTEWVERDTTPAVRAFAKTVKAVYQPLANAVAAGEFVEFNGEKADTFTGSESIGEISLTYSADNNGLGMAFKAADNDYIITASQAASFTLDNDVSFTAQAGYYNGEAWVSSDEEVAVNGNTVTLTANQIVRLSLKAAYEVFGEEIEYDLSSGLAVEGDTLENGATVVTNTTADRKTITLSEDIADFKLSYRFQNGSGWGSSGVLAPVLVTARGSYKFANTYYNPNGDLFFGGGGETDRHIVGGGTSGWHTAEIIMKGDRVKIIYDGIVWLDSTLVKGAASGALSLGLRYEDTKIADLKVEAVGDGDIYKIADADFTSGANTSFTVAGTYSSDEGAFAVTDQWNSYTLAGPKGLTLSESTAASAESYTLEIVVRHEGITTAAYQRGAEIHLPSGYSVGIFGSQVRTAEKQYLTGYGSSYFTYREVNLMDGNYHTVKVISKYDYEQIIVDGKVLKTYEITDRAAGNIVWKNNKNEGTTYIKSIKLTDNTELTAYKAYNETQISVSDRNSSERITTRTDGGSISDSSWSFKTSFYVDDLSALDTNVFWLRFRTTDSGNNNALLFSIAKDQYYVQKTNCGVVPVTDDNGYVPYTVQAGKWIDVELTVVGNYIITAVDGKSDVWYAQNGIFAAADTNDHIQLFEGCETVSFKDTGYYYIDQTADAVNTIEAIGEVTGESGQAILSAYDAYDILGLQDKAVIEYFGQKLAAAYEEYSALYDDGDVTEDGNVNVIDLIRLKKIASGSVDKTVKSNVDGDSARIIDSLDLAAQKKILLNR